MRCEVVAIGTELLLGAGLVCPVGDKVVYAVPGVPAEMREMVLGTVLPDLRRRAGQAAVIRARVLRTWGMSESGLAEILATRIDELDRLPDGEAVLKGTDVEAHRIAALLAGGMGAEEVREDYPSLTLEQIATARAYAEAYPKSGRPYPAKTVKRALKGAGLEALDEVLDKEE
jgi:molybdopterin-biosynthesis enzyme MoeA-like protein